MLEVIENFVKYKTFLFSIVKRDISKKYYKSVLGMAWSVLDPVLHMLVMMVVFQYVLGRNIEHYSLYLLLGRQFFQFTSGGTALSLHSIGKNRGIISKIYVPKYMFVVSDLTVDLINTLFAFIPVIILVIIYRIPFTVYWFLVPVILIMQSFFTLGLCLMLSAYGLFYKDLTHLYGIFVFLWHYLTPIFYSLDSIDPRYHFIWMLNPLTHFLQIYRDIIYSSVAPSPNNFMIAGIYTVLTFGLGCVIFKESQNRFFLYL